MTFYLCKSFYSKSFLNKIKWGKFCLSSKEYPVRILAYITCSWFWDELNRHVRRTGAIPTTLNLLKAKLLYEWNKPPQNNYVQRYAASMRRRCLAVENSAGGHTCY